MGYLPDVSDSRDFRFDELLSAARLSEEPLEAVDFRGEVQRLGILSQGDLGSCVAHGGFGAIRLQQALSGIQSPLLGCRLLGYWGARALIGTQEWDSGSHIRNFFRFLNSVGYMPEDETVNGYDVTLFTEGPTPAEQRLMSDQRDKGEGQVGYYRVFESGAARVRALKQALSNHIIPVLGTETTQEFLDYEGGILKRPTSVQGTTGGHAFYLCGYDEDCAYVPNSWGRGYGEEGFLRLSWDYITWEETRDIWCVERAPYYSHHLKAEA